MRKAISLFLPSPLFPPFSCPLFFYNSVGIGKAIIVRGWFVGPALFASIPCLLSLARQPRIGPAQPRNWQRKRAKLRQKTDKDKTNIMVGKKSTIKGPFRDLSSMTTFLYLFGSKSVRWGVRLGVEKTAHPLRHRNPRYRWFLLRTCL